MHQLLFTRSLRASMICKVPFIHLKGELGQPRPWDPAAEHHCVFHPLAPVAIDISALLLLIVACFDAGVKSGRFICATMNQKQKLRAAIFRGEGGFQGRAHSYICVCIKDSELLTAACTSSKYFEAEAVNTHFDDRKCSTSDSKIFKLVN